MAGPSASVTVVRSSHRPRRDSRHGAGHLPQHDRRAARRSSLAQLATRVTDGELTIRVAETMPLEEFKRGYERLAQGGLRGKIVFTM